MKTCRQYASTHIQLQPQKHTMYTYDRHNANTTQTTRANSSKCKLNLNNGHC